MKANGSWWIQPLDKEFESRNSPQMPRGARTANWKRDTICDASVLGVVRSYKDLGSQPGSCKLLNCFMPILWHGRGHRFDPDQVHQLNHSTPTT